MGDVSALDKGGRTVMHIIAQDHGLLMVDPDFYKIVSLVKRDNVLQWTPMQYAIKSEKWFIVDRLLESNVDRSGLDMIRQRAQDPDYINSLILHAAENGHLSLPELLCSIGVNIHQASSRRFPSTLHAAIQEQQLKVIKWLIQHGADCNTPHMLLPKAPWMLSVHWWRREVHRWTFVTSAVGQSLTGSTIMHWILRILSLPLGDVKQSD